LQEEKKYLLIFNSKKTKRI